MPASPPNRCATLPCICFHLHPHLSPNTAVGGFRACCKQQQCLRAATITAVNAVRCLAKKQVVCERVLEAKGQADIAYLNSTWLCSYGQHMPEHADFVSEPPLLPAQTKLTPLDLPHSEWVRQAPAFGDAGPRAAVPVAHAVLNHMFLQAGSAAAGSEGSIGNALLLGTCTRYKTKHVVTIMYKPAKKQQPQPEAAQ